MYELKKIGKVFTSKFVRTGPSSYKKKKNLPGRGLTKVEKHWFRRRNFKNTIKHLLNDILLMIFIIYLFLTILIHQNSYLKIITFSCLTLYNFRFTRDAIFSLGSFVHRLPVNIAWPSEFRVRQKFNRSDHWSQLIMGEFGLHFLVVKNLYSAPITGRRV